MKIRKSVSFDDDVIVYLFDQVLISCSTLTFILMHFEAFYLFVANNVFIKIF